MSFVSDQVRSLDLQLDRLQLDRFSLPSEDAPSTSTHASIKASTSHTARALRLQGVIKTLSTTSANVAKPELILRGLRDADLMTHDDWEVELAEENAEPADSIAYEKELEWIVVSKAAIQTYGLILDALVEQTLPLSNDLFYWDEVLSDYRYTMLYSLQTSPVRFWNFSKEVYDDARRRLHEIRRKEFSLLGNSADQEAEASKSNEGLSVTLKKFYGLVRTSIRDRSLLDLNKRVVSPFSLIRQDIRKKQAYIRRLKEMKASGLGVLVNEGLSFETEEEQEDWKGVVERTVVLMENVVRNVTQVDQTVEQFEYGVFTRQNIDIDIDPETPTSGRRNSMYDLASKKDASVTPYLISTKLQDLLSKHLPAQTLDSRYIAALYGRPGRLTRYWIPAATFLLSGSTILRILISRKAGLKTWVQDFGATCIDFWQNWVIEPSRRILGTIRHSEDSDVALMSRRSLTADMESLERMVIDFAIDNPTTSAPDSTVNVTKLDEVMIATLRERVKEGDLTPVLKVYERDMKSPIWGALRGELVRTLLIQIQKTKVDVEVAISGIDSLLKSQELVFGFIGLTPGVLVCIGVYRWFTSAFGSRTGLRTGEVKTKMLRTLRNLDRILENAKVLYPDQNTLNFKEHGLLLCEIHVLRGMAKVVMPRDIMADFVEEMNDLGNIKHGIAAQEKVLARIRWAYAKYIK